MKGQEPTLEDAKELCEAIRNWNKINKVRSEMSA